MSVVSTAAVPSQSTRLAAIRDAVLEGNLSHLMDAVTAKNVNYIDPDTRLSLLMIAVTLGRLPTVEFLLSQGASLLLLDKHGFTVMHRAVWSGDVAVVRSLLFLSPSAMFASPMQSASVAGAQQTPPFANNAAINSLTWRPGAAQLVNMPHRNTGRTPLMLAAVRGDVEIVRFLLAYCHADLLAKDNSGLTAVDLAALCGHRAMMELLIVHAPGDDVRQAFPEVQHKVEEFSEVAKTISQRAKLEEMNQLLCRAVQRQTRVSAA